MSEKKIKEEKIKTDKTEITKVYEFRRLKSTDVFLITNILKKIEINKFKECLNGSDITNLIKNLTEQNEVLDDNVATIVGINIYLNAAQVILENINKCENDIYDLLSKTSNLSSEEIQELDATIFVEMIVDFIKKEEFADFIKAASKFLK